MSYLSEASDILVRNMLYIGQRHVVYWSERHRILVRNMLHIGQEHVVCWSKTCPMSVKTCVILVRFASLTSPTTIWGLQNVISDQNQTRTSFSNCQLQSKTNDYTTAKRHRISVGSILWITSMKLCSIGLRLILRPRLSAKVPMATNYVHCQQSNVDICHTIVPDWR